MMTKPILPQIILSQYGITNHDDKDDHYSENSLDLEELPQRDDYIDSDEYDEDFDISSEEGESGYD